MPPHKLNSTSISHVDFHEPDNLEIKFNTGQVYHYKECEKDHFHGLKMAKSAGQYFRQNVLGKYKHEKQ